MIVYISSDERFPDYSIQKMDICYTDAYDKKINIPDELFYKFIAIQNLYDEIQNELEKLAKKSKYNNYDNK